MRQTGRLVVIADVAGGALGAQPGEGSRRCALVATLAGRHRMGADQRETVGVFPRLLDSNTPTLHRMALLAIASKPPSMNVGVAGGAFFADILENPVDVTRGAGNPLMHAQQRPSRLGVVVEFRLRTDRLPGCGRVATLTSDFQRAVRIRRAAGRRAALPECDGDKTDGDGQ